MCGEATWIKESLESQGMEDRATTEYGGYADKRDSYLDISAG
jgi:hypothetical protein